MILIGNSQYQPETEDPLGLTRAQWEADPRQVDPVAVQFDTRKTINQTQGGIAVDHRFDADTALHVAGYGGRRMIRQYLALQGTLPTSSGGVTDLDRDFGGIGARLVWQTGALGAPFKLTVGGDATSRRSGGRGSSTTTARSATCAATRTTRSRAPTATPRRNSRRGRG